MNQALNALCFELEEMFGERIKDKIYRFSMYNTSEYRLDDHIDFLKKLVLEDLKGTCVEMNPQTWNQTKIPRQEKLTNDSTWHMIVVKEKTINSVFFYLK